MTTSRLLVSFILASNKPEYFADFCANLEDSTRSPHDLEIVVCIDDGDDEMRRCIEGQQRIRPFEIKTLSEPPCGYYNLWRSINKLHGMCDNSAYFINNVNDEIRFTTNGWDDILRRYVSFFGDDVFRLRISAYKQRNYNDYWECGFAPENYAFHTRKWIDLQGDWNACHGPDAFQQMVAYRLLRAKFPEKAQINRDVVVWDIDIRGEGVNVSISREEEERRAKGGWRAWFTLVSYRMQEEANRRARRIQAYVEARSLGYSEADFDIVDVPARKRVKVISCATGEPLYDSRGRPMRYSYSLARLPIYFVNSYRRLFKYYYCGGEQGATTQAIRRWIDDRATYLTSLFFKGGKR